jgi:hypothetical protein
MLLFDQSLGGMQLPCGTLRPFWQFFYTCVHLHKDLQGRLFVCRAATAAPTYTQRTYQQKQRQSSGVQKAKARSNARSATSLSHWACVTMEETQGSGVPRLGAPPRPGPHRRVRASHQARRSRGAAARPISRRSRTGGSTPRKRPAALGRPRAGWPAAQPRSRAPGSAAPGPRSPCSPPRPAPCRAAPLRLATPPRGPPDPPRRSAGCRRDLALPRHAASDSEFLAGPRALLLAGLMQRLNRQGERRPSQCRRPGLRGAGRARTAGAPWPPRGRGLNRPGRAPDAAEPAQAPGAAGAGRARTAVAPWRPRGRARPGPSRSSLLCGGRAPRRRPPTAARAARPACAPAARAGQPRPASGCTRA